MKLFSHNRLTNEQFPALTGIRAVAAFMVFFHHLPLHLQPGFVIGWQLSFYTGVTVFFVLSGFLITYRYYGEIKFSRNYGWNYFVNRFARIYPLYFLVLTVVILSIKNFSPVFLLQNYTLTHNLSFLFPSHGLAIGPSWSLTVEECFYLIAPFLFFLCRKFNFWIAFTSVLLVLLLLISKSHSPGLDTGLIFSSFFGNSIAFFSGIYLALLILKKQKINTAANRYRTFTGIAGVILLSLPLIYVTNKNNSLKHPVMAIFNNLLMPFPVALFFYGLICENTLVRKFLSTGILHLLGKSSYAFYLVHLPFIELFARPYIQPFFADGYYNLFVAAVLILVLILSVLLYLFFESPINKLIRRKLLVPVSQPKYAGLEKLAV